MDWLKFPRFQLVVRNQIRKLHKEIGQKNFFSQLIKLRSFI